MSAREAKLHELQQLMASLPEPAVAEVLDFAQFLAQRVVRRAGETALLSQAALSEIWETPEEDEAWRDL